MVAGLQRWDIILSLLIVAQCVMIMIRPRFIAAITPHTDGLGTAPLRSVVRVPLLILNFVLPPQGWWRSFWRLAAVFWSLSVPLVFIELAAIWSSSRVDLGPLFVSVNVQIWIGVVLIVAVYKAAQHVLGRLLQAQRVTLSDAIRAVSTLVATLVGYFIGLVFLQTFVTVLAIHGELAFVDAFVQSCGAIVSLLTCVQVTCPLTGYGQCATVAVLPAILIAATILMWEISAVVWWCWIWWGGLTDRLGQQSAWQIGAFQVAAGLVVYIMSQLA